MPRPKARFEITAEDKTKAAFDSAERGFQSLAKAGVVVAGVGAVLGAATVKAIGHADAIAKMAKAAGVTTDAYQELSFAASQMGVGQSQLDDALVRFTKRLGLADQGAGAAVKAYQQLGIATRDSTGHMRDSGDVIREVADRIAHMSSVQEQTAYTTQFFGDDASKLRLLLEGGSQAMDGMAKTAHGLGIVISGDLLKNAEDASDQLDRMKRVAEAQSTVLLSALFPAVIGVGNAFAEAAPKIKEFIDFLNPDSTLSLYHDLSEVEGRIKSLQTTISKGGVVGDKAAERAAGAGGFLGTTVAGLKASFDPSALQAELERQQAEADRIRAEIQKKYSANRIDTGGLVPPAPDQPPSTGGDAEMEREQAKTDRMLQAQEQRFQALREARLQAEGRDVELEQARFETKLEQLQEEQAALLEQQQLTDEQRMELKTQFDTAIEDAHATHTARLNDISKRAADEQKKLDEQAASAKAAAAERGKATVISSLEGIASKSKALSLAMLVVEKGKAVADVIVWTQVAMARALADLGPIAGPIAAAAFAASGAASVALIAQQGLSSSGGSSGGGGGFGSGGAVSTGGGGDNQSAGLGSGVAPRVTEQDQNAGSTQLTIVVNASGVISSNVEDFADKLHPLIQDRIHDSVKNSDAVFIPAGSRQALELQGA